MCVFKSMFIFIVIFLAENLQAGSSPADTNKKSVNISIAKQGSKFSGGCNTLDDKPFTPCPLEFGPLQKGGSIISEGFGVDIWVDSDFSDVTISSVSLSGSTDIFIYDDRCSGIELSKTSPTGSPKRCVVYVAFLPSTAGKKTATFSFTYSGLVYDRDVGDVVSESGTHSMPITGTAIVVPLQGAACFSGSIIRSSTQALGEVIPITGTDFYLSYSSMFTGDYISPDYSSTLKNFFNPEGWNISISAYLDITTSRIYTGDGRIEQHPIRADGSGGLLASSSDGNDIFVFDAVTGRITKTITALTGATKYTFAYDSAGFLSGVSDAYGNQTTFNRDSSGRLTSVVSPFGQITAVTENAAGLLASVQNPNGEVFSMTYQAGTSLLKTFTKPGLQTSTFTYDANGRLTQDLGNGGNYWNLVQGTNGLGRPTVDITSKLGRNTHLDTVYSNYINQTLPNGLVRSHSEDNIGYVMDADPRFSRSRYTTNDERLGDLYGRTLRTTLTMGGVTATVSNAQSVTYPSGTSPGLFNYKKLTNTETFAGNTSTMIFDLDTRTKTMTSAAGATKSVVLDSNEKPVQTQLGNDTPVTITYDSNGRLSQTSQGSHKTTTYGYNSSGYLSSVTNARGETTSFGYDLAGRRTSVTLPDTRTILFSYDANGNVVGVTTPSSRVHNFSFNAFELTSGYQPPSIGAGISKDTIYSYNDDKQLTLITRPDGRTIAYNYGASTGGLLSIVTDEGNYVYTYDPTTKLLSQLNSPNNITDVFSYQGTLLTQDVQRQTSTGTVSGRIAFGYDSNLRLSSRSIYNGGAAISRNYTYNSDSQYSQVGDLSLNYEYPSGRLSTTVIDRISDNRTYDSYGDLVGYSASYSPTSGSPSVLYAYALTRDVAGRIIAKNETVLGVSSLYEYSYDAVGRLIQVKVNGNVESFYTYDNNGNRTSGKIGGVPFVATYDNQDRIQMFNNKSYVFSADGDLIRILNPPRNDATFDYGAKGNLHLFTSSTGDQYEYIVDGRDRRVGRKLNGTKQWGRIFAKHRIEGEYSGGSLQKEYIHATDDLSADYMIVGSNRFRLIKDYLGSVRLVVDTSTGAVAQRLDYDEWGRVVRDSNSCFQPFGFAGGTYDEQTGLVLFGARDYDPETGRWLAKDPVGFDGGDTNLYGYAVNDPINRVDRSGLEAEEVGPDESFYKRASTSIKEYIKAAQKSCSDAAKAVYDQGKEDIDTLMTLIKSF